MRDVAGQSDTYDYFYNESWQVLEVWLDGDDTYPIEQMVWHPYYIDALAVRWYDAETDGNEVEHYYLQDANFNVTAVVNWVGTVLERYQYWPYGEVGFLEDDFDVAGSQDESAIGNQHLYTGRERDFETGLQLNRNRFYAAHLGRWVMRDPIGYAGRDFNFYGYVFSNPTVLTDATGLSCWTDCMKQMHGRYWDQTKNCFTAAGIGGAVGAEGCLLGCLFSSVAYPICVTGCFGNVGITVAGAGACCIAYYQLKMGGAAIGCSIGCWWD